MFDTWVTFDGITLTGGDYRMMQSDDVMVQHDWKVVDEPDALLRIRNAVQITVKNNTFVKSGGTSLPVDHYGQQVSITNNRFRYLGLQRHRARMEKWDAVAIMIDQSLRNHIHYNVIQDTYFTQ